VRVVYCAVWERYDLTRDGSLRRRHFLHSFIVCEPAKHDNDARNTRRRRWRWHEADPSVHNNNNWSYETTIKCIGDRKDAAAATAAVRKIQLPETDRRRAEETFRPLDGSSARVTRRRSASHGPSPGRGAIL